MKWDNLRVAQNMVKSKKSPTLMPLAFKMICIEIRELKNKVKKLEKN